MKLSAKTKWLFQTICR